MNKDRKLKTVFAVIFMLFQISCGGGSGGTSTPNNNTNQVIDENHVNGDAITGRLFMGGDNDGLILDLSTGKYSQIPGVDWTEELDNEYHSMANYTAMPSSDGTEFVVSVSNCLNTTDSEFPSLFDDCIEIRSNNGDLIGTGKLIEEISRNARLSRNKQYFAFFHNDSRYQNGNDELVIFDRNFQFISSSYLPSHWARSFDWLNDSGQIVYIHDQTVYVTAPYGTMGTPIYTFTEDAGRPDYISASPDGTKIAFTLVTSASMHSIHGSTWIMNADGTDLHQLAYVPNNDNPIINYPAWSPDGKFIMNMVGYVSGQDDEVVGITVFGGLYAIPSDSRNVALNDDGDGGIVHIVSYYNSNELNNDFASNGNLVWIP